MSGWSYPLELVGENEWNFYMRTCIKVSVGIVWRAIGNTQELYWIHWWLPLENYYMLCGWMLRNLKGETDLIYFSVKAGWQMDMSLNWYWLSQ